MPKKVLALYQKFLAEIFDLFNPIYLEIKQAKYFCKKFLSLRCARCNMPAINNYEEKQITLKKNYKCIFCKVEI